MLQLTGGISTIVAAALLTVASTDTVTVIPVTVILMSPFSLISLHAHSFRYFY